MTFFACTFGLSFSAFVFSVVYLSYVFGWRFLVPFLFSVFGVSLGGIWAVFYWCFGRVFLFGLFRCSYVFLLSDSLPILIMNTKLPITRYATIATQIFLENCTNILLPYVFQPKVSHEQTAPGKSYLYKD